MGARRGKPSRRPATAVWGKVKHTTGERQRVDNRTRLGVSKLYGKGER